MVYRATGVTHDYEKKCIKLLCAELEENGGQWSYRIMAKQETAYPGSWQQQLEQLSVLPVNAFFRLHNAMGKFTGDTIQNFITENKLDFQVQLIGMTGCLIPATEPGEPEVELGSPAMVAAITGVNVVSHFPDINRALQGRGREIYDIPARLLPVAVPDDFTAPLYTALLAVLRWREENNISASSTGAIRDCIGGAVWMGQEA